MSNFQVVPSNNWSTLSTIKSIDTDYGVSKDIIPQNGEICKPNAKSLFIESIVEQLCQFLEKDPHRQRKLYEGMCAKLFEMKLVDGTYRLEELASLRGYYQNAIISLLRTHPSLHKMPSCNLEWSRYSTEYEEVGFIAAGGFGKVYKARHRLDQAFYAVKKISVKFKNMSVLIMESNEVKTLAKLNHPNIVQYKAAWLEPVLKVLRTLPTVEDVPQETSSDSDDIVFQGSNSSLSLNQDCSSSSVQTENENNMVLCKYNQNDIHENQSNNLLEVNAVLYVSMQLCDETLREWLNKRNALNQPVDIPVCIDIMIQAVKGIEYIHSCNIVHHDIKPSNIFLSNNLKSVQVGDFGLSCGLQGRSHSGCPLEGGRFGTPLYAAPEQHKTQCNLKSDMYSLGILFIELVTVFSTEMERVSVLTKSRASHIPSTVPTEIVPIVKKLLSSNADERPTSSELLKMLYKLVKPKPVTPKSPLSITKTQVFECLNERKRADSTSQTHKEEICDVNEMLKLKDREITELKLMLAKRDDEIARLRQHIHSGFLTTLENKH